MENTAFLLPANRGKPDLPPITKKESTNKKTASPFNRILDQSKLAKQSRPVSDEEPTDDKISENNDLTNQGNNDNLTLSLIAALSSVIPDNAQQILNQTSAPTAKEQFPGVLLNSASQAAPVPVSVLHQEQTANIQLDMVASKFVQTLTEPLSANTGEAIFPTDGKAQAAAQVPIQPELQSMRDVVSTAVNPVSYNQTAQSLLEELSKRSQPFIETTQASSEDTFQLGDLQPKQSTSLPVAELIPEAVQATKEKQLLTPVVETTELPIVNQPVTRFAKREQLADQSKGNELSAIAQAEVPSVDKQLLSKEQDFLSQDSFSSHFALTELPTGKHNVAAFDTTSQIDSPNQHDIIKQIVDHARVYLRPGNQSEMILQLKPENLGQLTLKVSVGNGVVNAAFHSDNPEVRQVIEASLPQLRQDLSQQGIKLDTVSVFSGSEQFFDNRQPTAQQQQFTPMRKNRREFLQAVELSEESLVSTTDGVDYRI